MVGWVSFGGGVALSPSWGWGNKVRARSRSWLLRGSQMKPAGSQTCLDAKSVIYHRIMKLGGKR